MWSSLTSEYENNNNGCNIFDEFLSFGKET